MILAEVQLFFRREMLHLDNLAILIRISGMSAGTCVMDYGIEREAAVVAEEHTRLAAFDYGRRSPTRWPTGFRDGVAAFERLA